jgi:hypothetical protein
MSSKAKKEQTVGTFFPVDPKGGRSTTWAGKEVIAAAFRGAQDPYSAEHLLKTSNSKWRFGYNKAYLNLVESCCKSPASSLGAANAGLDWMYNHFQHVNKEGEEPKTFKQMLNETSKSKLIYGTKKIIGTQNKPKKFNFEVPYDGGWSPSRPKAPPPSAMVSGETLKAIAGKWVKKGIVEPDAASAINWTVDYFNDGGDLSNCHFVLIGAGSAMGPCAKLLELGANVVAIDIPGKWGERPEGLWTRLINLAKESSGSLTFPTDLTADDSLNDEKKAGCDLTAKPGDIANWLVDWQSKLPADAKVTIGNYTYLDGDLHVKLALCADVCIEALRKARPSSMIAFLCTPTDIHVTTKEAHAASKRNRVQWHKGMLFEMFVKLITFNKTLVPNDLKPVPTEAKKDPLYLVDGLSVAQGPNYALAKRMQHWRAMVAYEEGSTVSTAIAPSTATLSVIHNKTFAWAYGGMPHFKFEIFKQETTNAVMTALLLHDLLNEKGSKNPKKQRRIQGLEYVITFLISICAWWSLALSI